MLELKDLLNTSEGCDFLESNGIFIASDEFITQLRPPIQSGLANHFGVNNRTKLVYTAQQIYVDYKQSVLSKVSILKYLQNETDIFPFAMWIDTDRCGSDKLSTRFTLPLAGKERSFNLVPHRSKDRHVETRFVKIDDKLKLKQFLDQLGMYLTQSIPDSSKQSKAMEKCEQLKQAFLADEADTLRAINYQITSLLFSQGLGFKPPAIFMSDMLSLGLVTDAVHLVLNNIASVICVFNAQVQDLLQANINPQVRPLADSYLPFYYSCHVDQRRIKLHHDIDGDDHYAIGTCKCGADYRFYLGSQSLSIAELAATHRWSPDVLAPIFFNDLVSGYIAGKSSALYGLVLNRVLSQVLDKKPIPMLVPEGLGATVNAEDRFDSLMYRYLTE